MKMTHCVQASKELLHTPLLAAVLELNGTHLQGRKKPEHRRRTTLADTHARIMPWARQCVYWNWNRWAGSATTSYCDRPKRPANCQRPNVCSPRLQSKIMFALSFPHHFHAVGSTCQPARTFRCLFSRAISVAGVWRFVLSAPTCDTLKIRVCCPFNHRRCDDAKSQQLRTRLSGTRVITSSDFVVALAFPRPGILAAEHFHIRLLLF